MRTLIIAAKIIRINLKEWKMWNYFDKSMSLSFDIYTFLNEDVYRETFFVTFYKLITLATNKIDEK